MREVFNMVPEVAELFRAHGIDHGGVWLGDPPGASVEALEMVRIALSLDETHDVWRVTLGGKGYYLKRRWEESPGSLLRMLCYGKKPVSSPIREIMLATRLKEAGFAVMEPVAWGEWRRRGLPAKGFLLTREIVGTPVEKVHTDGDAACRRDLLFRLGRLTGRLHIAGFFQHVRLKDLIETEGGELVLIDREAAKPWPRKFSWPQAVVCLSRTLRRTMRDGHRFSAGEGSAFFRGYAGEVKGRSGLTPKEIRRSAMKGIRLELGG
ncbi:hypothetical protein OVA24_02245 [Luteolibacter sp. SL250]|uniref:lipopolysaccharide kinase InaA family protein n=1 Tax=Luteolibacter sp. SL250 TaxID=2995170 RepID=UPI00226D5F0B|nr:lipopolysaccharide kinase InaA family protein [Luteolibacter sp. SL250]WAC20199.1 hypothetical protein OVA24_02245 [Luteolibacter sp. SL250]